MEKKHRTFRNRFFAGLIDGFIFLPLFIVGDYLTHKMLISVLWYDLAETIFWTIYVVVGHGKYGQTIGKWLMNVKVLNLEENGLIGYKKAFYRESIWFLISLSAIIYWLIKLRFENFDIPANLEKYENLTLFFAGGWIVIELSTMLMNNKRRALHDFMGGSVVVNLKYK